MGLVWREPWERKALKELLRRGSTTQPLPPAPRAAPAAPQRWTGDLAFGPGAAAHCWCDPEQQEPDSAPGCWGRLLPGVFIYNSLAGWRVCRKAWQLPRKGFESEPPGRMRTCLLLVFYRKPKSFLKYFERHWHWLWCCCWVYARGKETR